MKITDKICLQKTSHNQFDCSWSMYLDFFKMEIT